MKIIKKADVQFEDGMYYMGDETVSIPVKVRIQAEKLDLMWQEYQYLKGQPEYCSGPSLEGFERKSYKAQDRIRICAPETPVHDKVAAEAQAMIRELKAADAAEETNGWIDKFGDLVDFCGSEKFVDEGCTTTFFVDAPAIGNLMTLTQDMVAGMLFEMVTSPIQLEN